MFERVLLAIMAFVSLIPSGMAVVCAVWFRDECEDVDAYHEYRRSVVRAVLYGLVGMAALIALVVGGIS